MLELLDVTKIFYPGTVDENRLFENFNLTVKAGEFVSIIGSNGTGKSTVLNMVCGSLPIDGGSILFNGKDISAEPEYKRAAFIGRVFQDPKMGTCPHLTILENMALADNKNKSFNLSGAINKRRLDAYRTLLETCKMGLENRLNVTIGALSGGQRQALALLIANMADIRLLVLDEHTAALDPKSSEIIMELTDRMIREKGVTTLMVTHNLRHALTYGNRLLMFDSGQAIMDLAGEDKKHANLNDLLEKFNEISIEKGN